MNIANPSEVEFFEDNRFVHEGPLWLLHFGAYGSTALYVWADSIESAFEEAVEWLDDNAPGLLSTVGPDDYKRAADELGVAWQPEEQADADTYRVFEHAEADMTMIGHTTLNNGNCVPSWEWTIDVVARDSDDWRAVVAESTKLAAE